MILVYKSTDADEKRWDLDEVRVTFAEAKAAEKAGGFTWRQLGGELIEGNVSALQAALWVLLKRDKPALRFADLEDMPIDAASVEYSAVEKEFMRNGIEADEDMSSEEKSAALALLGISDEPAPKDE